MKSHSPLIHVNFDHVVRILFRFVHIFLLQLFLRLLVKADAFRMKSSVQFKVVTYANYIISSFIVNTANFADLVERSYEYISLLNVISDSIFFIAQIHCCLTLDAKGFI